MSLQDGFQAQVSMNDVGDETIGALLYRRARLHPDDTYCTFRGERISFGVLKRRVDQVATLLKSHGLVRGDRVAVMLGSNCTSVGSTVTRTVYVTTFDVVVPAGTIEATVPVNVRLGYAVSVKVTF